MKLKTNKGLKIICLNRKAGFNYFFNDLIEAGIVLKGSEIKSIRAGKVNIAESYAVEKNREIFLINSQQKCILKKEKLKYKLLLQKVKSNTIRDKQKKLKIGIVIKQDILENQAKIAFLAIGSNLGNKKRNIELAKFKLESNNIKIIKSSNNYETLSWPNKKKPKFINVVIKIKTNLSPIKLMQRCLDIEKELGRKRNKKNEPRTCDIDIVDYDQKVIKMNKSFSLNIPHSEMHKRNFVLLPLFEIAKSWIHPVKKKGIKRLLNSLNNRDLRTIKLI